MESLLNELKLAIEGLNTLTPDWILYGIIGGVLLSGTVAYITYRHLWKTTEKYTKTFIGFLLILIGFLIPSGGWLVTHSDLITRFLSQDVLASYADYVLPAWAAILLVANKFYELGGYKLWNDIADKLKKWSDNRAEKKAAKKLTFETNAVHAPENVETTNEQDAEVFPS